MCALVSETGDTPVFDEYVTGGDFWCAPIEGKTEFADRIYNQYRSSFDKDNLITSAAMWSAINAQKSARRGAK